MKRRAKQLHLVIPDPTPMECAAGYASKIAKKKPVQSEKSPQKDLFRWRQLPSQKKA